jgi:hypothetical protein
MVTKRTPRILPFAQRVTPVAIRAFCEMEEIKAEGCDCSHDCRDRYCEKLRQLDRVLRHEMKLPPWEYPTYGKRLQGHCDVRCISRYAMLAEAAAKKAPA